MNKFDDMHRKMTGKTKGVYKGENVTFSPHFGELKPGQVVVLPDDWDFTIQPLFKKHKEKVVKE